MNGCLFYKSIYRVTFLKKMFEYIPDLVPLCQKALVQKIVAQKCHFFRIGSWLIYQLPGGSKFIIILYVFVGLKRVARITLTHYTVEL